MIKEILNELNLENGSNYKIATLKKHQDNELLQRVLKMAYCKVDYVYSVTLKNVVNPNKNTGTLTLNEALDNLELLANRTYTGNAALEVIHDALYELNENDAYVLEKVIDRDLRINLGRTSINKVFKNLIKKQKYMRCAIGTSKELQKLDWESGIHSQLKMDGQYRQYSDGVFTARSGKIDHQPILEKALEGVESNWVLTGELTLRGEKDRQKGNGEINSKTPNYNDIIFTIWDAVKIDEYSQKNGTTKYDQRLGDAKEIVYHVNHPNIELIQSKIVHSPKEAYTHFQELTKNGFEGTVIKTRDGLWKDGTSRDQLKIKLAISVDCRITGFTEGRGKRSEYFGAIEYTTDDGKIQGKVSGFSDKEMEAIHADRENYIGKVMEIECNDITIGKNATTYALSHPRYITQRTDKNTTDTLERALESKKMAMDLDTRVNIQ